MHDFSALIRRNLPLGVMRLLEITAAEAEARGLTLYAVGGFVRDLLLGTPKLDVDILIEGDAIGFGMALCERFGGHLHKHQAFGTAKWRIDAAAAAALDLPRAELPPFLDLVTARSERYAYPAALPTVAPGSLRDDLLRRDFTINTLAARLAPRPLGTMVDLFGGEADLREGIIRVLHNASFVDDPTRIFRATRFEGRLGFVMDSHTEGLIPEALPYIQHLSGERIQHEFELLFSEMRPERSLSRMKNLKVLEQIHSALTFDEWIGEAFENARAFVAKPEWNLIRVDLSAIYWMLLTCRLADTDGVAARFRLDRHRTSQIMQGVHLWKALPALEAELAPSAAVRLLEGLSDEALIAGYAATTAPLARHNIVCYAFHWRFVDASLTGNDLRAMGVKPSPLMGALLARLHDACLDGEVNSPDEERAAVLRWLHEASAGS